MVDLDEIMMGIFISSFSAIGLCIAVYCVRECRRKPTMKKSSSSQELNTIHDSDPEVIV